MLRNPGFPPFSVNEDGWVSGVIRRPSEHFDARPEGAPIDLLVIHNISLPPGEFGNGCVERFFTDRLDISEDPSFESLEGLRVASHFFVSRDGCVTQFVSCRDRAWHAGVSHLGTRSRCNDFSIGIEVEGTDFVPFEDAQYRSLEALARAIILRYPVRIVAGHSDIAPGRKTDPGPYFDWMKLATPEIRACGVDFPFSDGKV